MMIRANRPKVYLASRYSRRAELQGYAAQLADLGLAEVPCRWLTEEHDWDGGTSGESLGKAQRYALDDIEDLERCHAVVVFTEEAGEYRRGGSLVELGLALATGKHVVLVGPAPNVFCTLPAVPRFAAWVDALAHLTLWKDAAEQASIRRRLLPS